MSQSTLREVEHEITVSAPADTVYRYIAEVVNWPRIFPPTIHVEHLERAPGTERIRIWATANDEAKTWTSRRTLAPEDRRIGFRQEVSTPPVAQMGGAWLFEPLDDGRTRIRLLHDYRAVDDDPAGLEWIDRAVDRNSRSELDALKRNVEAAVSADELTFDFEDSVTVRGRAKDLFDFIDRADLWAQRLPHVAEVDLREPSPGLQSLEMRTRAKDGSTHLTKSYRVTFPHRSIAYKQVTLPGLLDLHTGRWTFAEDEATGITTATSQHTVTLKPDAVEGVLGAGAGVADAREYVRGALSANSLATLGHARDHAEGAAGG
ncbi:aromatase/cyclase [Pseudonocardia nematodicida]|uniref:Aromatase/cyclase n=1 Tax=Pseudonocardia nematodicida TaxID=1206997 RepID=A0ABV1KEA8_9PSEU